MTLEGHAHPTTARTFFPLSNCSRGKGKKGLWLSRKENRCQTTPEVISILYDDLTATRGVTRIMLQCSREHNFLILMPLPDVMKKLFLSQTETGRGEKTAKVQKAVSLWFVMYLAMDCTERIALCFGTRDGWVNAKEFFRWCDLTSFPSWCIICKWLTTSFCFFLFKMKAFAIHPCANVSLWEQMRVFLKSEARGLLRVHKAKTKWERLTVALSPFPALSAGLGPCLVAAWADVSPVLM